MVNGLITAPAVTLVSVIMPFYDTNPAFMQAAIDSVLQQTYPNLELLLVDDGSTGVSSALGRQYAARNPGVVRYLDHAGHRNQGISASRQLGIEMAQGAYIAMLDADDIWLPRKLEQQVAILEAEPAAGMLYGLTRYWFSWTGHAADRRRDFAPALGVAGYKLYQPPALLVRYLEGQAAVPCTCSVILRRAGLEEIGGFETSFTGMYEDQVFYAKASTRVPIYVSHTCWDWYRQHGNSISHKADALGQRRTAHLRYLRWLAGYLADHQVKDKALWQALNRQLWLYHGWPSSARRLPGQRHVQWAKKWLLRIEALCLPPQLRRWLWLRQVDKSQWAD